MAGWQDQANSMIDHGAVKSGIYSHVGDCWAHCGMDKVTKQEMETLVSNIRSGKREMQLQGKGCIVMNLVQGVSITGKAKGEEGEDRPLWHAIIGKVNCVYLAAAMGNAERGIVDTLETKFGFLKEY